MSTFTFVRVATAFLFVIGSACTSDSRDGNDSGGKADSAEIPELENGVAAPVEPQPDATALFKFEVPDGQTLLRLALDGDAQSEDGPDADLFVKRGSPPTETDHDFRQVTSGPVEHIQLPALAGTWFVLVVFDGNPKVTLTATWNDTEIGTRILENGVPVTIPTVDEDTLFYIDVPPGKSDLKFEVTVGSGADPILCIGMKEVPQAFNGVGALRCESPRLQGELAVHVFLPKDSEGRWSIAVAPDDFGTSKKLKLLASYDDKPIATPEPIEVGTRMNIEVAGGTGNYYALEVPEGTSRLTIDVTNPTDSGTVFARPGALPTRFLKAGVDSFFGTDPGELTIDNPKPGPWFLRIDSDSSKTIAATLQTSID